MLRYFRFNEQEFMHHCRHRSNVESAFNMVKSKFGDSVRNKTTITWLGLDVTMEYKLPPSREIPLPR